MEDQLIELLESFDYPVFRQGSIAPEQQYPDTFLTFWNTTEEGQSFYDNETASVVWQFRVYSYSISPITAYSVLAAARKLLKENGWIMQSRAYDVRSDEATHVGRGMTVEFLLYGDFDK